ncbi:MAG: NAD(P)-dependent oxidoreductase [Rhodospirillaceae bacterium]|jgi:3-hydroxyisobutyrate dehydrogenase|nr:NAD(P)-dependent oxidoreductase [Rhodospirillaceae bacterium]MBT4486429.1 NAD(P)-dependent oxidoreductase [Rhodospirillaceae bacterium]MBT5195222.1 NAD(P)-dependent oxidoreductase [Rhodospirillaceae bacterium]MBT5897679.1 NAD(P)-dependent oxidoreductase [Rhodospirillaceae bacterium]MBT6427811.1 NAD(P)-dependent oxidoreductase [Rhodospirillaceae bacterium]
MTSKTVGFIGLGDMGAPMAANLLAKGFGVVSCAHRRREAIEELAQQGLIEKDNPRLVADDVDILMTIVIDEAQTDNVLRGENGALAGLKSGATIIIMSTLSPDYCQALGAELAARDISVIDCPVSGAVMGAENGTLALIAGGGEAAVERCRAALETMGTIFHCGDLGMGMVAKLANNSIMFATGSLVQEARGLARAYGMDMDLLMEIIKSGTADSFIAQNWTHAANFMPDSYKIMLKDLEIVKTVAADKQVEMPMLEAHLSKDWEDLAPKFPEL